mgnify:CR=1 FL=1
MAQFTTLTEIFLFIWVQVQISGFDGSTYTEANDTLTVKIEHITEMQVWSFLFDVHSKLLIFSLYHTFELIAYV